MFALENLHICVKCSHSDVFGLKKHNIINFLTPVITALNTKWSITSNKLCTLLFSGYDILHYFNTARKLLNKIV